MRNRWIIWSFAFLLGGFAFAQSGDDAGSVDPFEQELRISVYPNPAVEYLEIKLDNSNLEKAEFELHSIIGNQMMINVREVGSNRYRIPVKSFPTGYYFLVVKDEKSHFKKAIKFLKD